MEEARLKRIKNPNSLISYWTSEPWICISIAITGIIYNFGMLASPYFEGALIDGIEANSGYQSILALVLYFFLAIFLTQLCRALKRYFVRHFACVTTYKMRSLSYNALLSMSSFGSDSAETGILLSRNIGDIKNAVEGMRKLTTEIFDTITLFIFYATFLFLYDWKMTIYALIPVLVAILAAFFMRKPIYLASKESREANGVMSAKTYNLFDKALTYRLFGRDKDNLDDYDKTLSTYEKKTVKASALTDSMIPVANLIALIGIIPILVLGSSYVISKNPLTCPINGIMQSNWTIGAFSTYLTTFVLLASKASHAAKLFGSIENGLASWKRVEGTLQPYSEYKTLKEVSNDSTLKIDGLGVSFHENTLFSSLSLEAKKGEIIGVAGPIASGKSVFAKLFLHSFSYEGKIVLFGRDLSSYSADETYGTISYMGHHNELFNASIKDNVMLGKEEDPSRVLKMVSFDKDLVGFKDGVNTIIGNEGTELSGGQQERLCLARSIAHPKGLVILDDPFASLDEKTMEEIFPRIRSAFPNSLVILISSRLYFFPELDHVLFFDKNGGAYFSSHEDLYKNNVQYASLFDLESRRTGDKK